MPQSAGAPNFERLVAMLRRRGVWIAVCLVLGAAAAYLYSHHQERKYTATSSVVFNSQQLSQVVAGLQPSLAGQAQLNSDVKLVASGDVARKTAEQLGGGLTAEKVSESLSVSQEGETSVIGESSVVDISMTMTSAAQAAAVANSYAAIFVSEQAAANHQYYAHALAIVKGQLARMSPVERLGSAGAALQTRIQSLSLLANLQYSGVQVSREAVVPTVPSSPKTSRDVALGALVGLLIGLGLALALERLDGRLGRPEDVEGLYGAPLLGTIGENRRLQQAGSEGASSLEPTEAEAFRMVLAHLRAFSSRSPGSVLITSAGSGDGKTTVATRLAEAAVAVGSRALLVELDMRRPTVGRMLGLPPGPGMSEVLRGMVEPSEAIRQVPLASGAEVGRAGATLEVVTAGAALAETPAKLLDGRAMQVTLEWMRSAYDLVVIDAPALTTVSDAYPLLGVVDGVIVVARPADERRQDSEALRMLLERSRATVLGVIANRVPRRAQRPYGYGGQEQTNPPMQDEAVAEHATT